MADLPVQKIRRETGVETDLGLDMGVGVAGHREVERDGMLLSALLAGYQGGGAFWYPG